MVKKISYLIIAVIVLFAGCIAFITLNYWERSIRIFSINDQDQFFEGRMGRSHNGFRESLEKPDGSGGELERHEEFTEDYEQQIGNEEGFMESSQLEGRTRNLEGHDREEFSGSKKINFRNVKWFLAVFASFAVLAIYLDKAYYLIRKRNQS